MTQNIDEITASIAEQVRKGFDDLAKALPGPGADLARHAGEMAANAVSLSGHLVASLVGQAGGSSPAPAKSSTPPAPTPTADKATPKAASATPAPKPAPEASSSAEDLSSMTKAELYEKAQAIDLDGRSTMSKAELIEALSGR